MMYEEILAALAKCGLFLDENSGRYPTTGIERDMGDGIGLFFTDRNI